RTQTSPGIMDAHVPDLRRDILSSLAQALHGVCVHAFIVARFLDSRAEQDAAIAARNDVHLRSANDVPQQRTSMTTTWLRDDADHLSFRRPRRRAKGSHLRGPGAGAIYNGSSGIERLDGADAGGATPQQCDLHDGRAGGEVNAAIPGSFLQGAAQLAGIDAALGQEPSWPAQRYQWLEPGELIVADSERSFALRRLIALEECDGSGITQIGRLECLVAQLANKLGIQARAGRDHARQFRWVMRIAVGDHSSCGVGRLASRLSLLDDQHVPALVPQAPRQRQSDDTGAND